MIKWLIDHTAAQTWLLLGAAPWSLERRMGSRGQHSPCEATAAGGAFPATAGLGGHEQAANYLIDVTKLPPVFFHNLIGYGY